MKTRRLLLMTMLALLASFHATLLAQTVNISPKTGNVISAVSYGSEAHEANFGGAWIHNQIPLMLLTSDEATLSEYELMAVHANNVSANGSGLRVVSGGNNTKNHMTLSLPKGYRFTSYRIVMSNSKQSGVNTTFKEMNADFTTAITSVSLGNHNNTTNEYSLSRTASSSADMGNILYFLQDKDPGTSYVDIKAFEITFECADPFTETLTPSATIASGVDCLQIPFSTCRTDLGQIELSTDKGYTSLKYNYTKVKDLPAYFTLYDMDGIENGSASPSALKDGHITTIGNYYGLKNDTYYIEVPTDATDQSGINNIPLGYRITGAKIHYTNAAPSSAIKLGDSFYITDGNGNYMNADLQFTSNPVVWNSDANGKVWTENTYLRENNFRLTTTTKKNNASSFEVEETNLYYQGWVKFFISNNNGSGSFTVSGTRAVLVSTVKSSYTVTLYDKDGKTVAQSADVNANNANGTLEVTGLNNDAIKFEVSGLADNASAYLYAELTLEALNPYISKVDVVAKQLDNEQTISQQYLADDFAIGNGLIDFKVPVNFAQKTIQFSFDNLTCKKADNTYGSLSNTGNSRYNFVKSEYYNLIGENLQAHRTEAANYDYTEKVAVAVTGTKAFKVNNSDKFKAGTSQSNETFYYEEFRYSNSKYAAQSGSFEAIQLANGNEKNVYLMVVDETRYNIAPTTTPRHAFYAYYTTNIKLSTEEYEPALTYVKVYDNAMLASGFDANAYYGVKVGAKNKGENTEVEAGKGYLFANQIVDQINADVKDQVAPVDAKHILYVDASGLNAVLYGTDTQWGKIEDIKDLIGTNAMIYLPQGATYSLDNLASKTVSGDFKAENNIVLVDKQPFYAPYNIRIDANNYAQYTREITNNNGVVNYASLVLPFTVAIDENGTHTNDDGQSEFTFYKMQLTNALSDPKQTDNYDYEVTGHFKRLSDMLATESNKPYLVTIDSYEPKDEGADILFVARQHGASIIKTPASLDGETAEGKLGSAQVSFVQHGTLNGVQLDKNKGYFYFAKDRFVSSLNLTTSDYVYVMPFRTYYDYAGAAQARYMNISLEPNSDITGISDITTGYEDRPFGFASGSGSLTITAFADITVNVRAVNGQTVERCTLKAGETRTVNVPAGIYIVNDKKVAVK